jgi:hypothetical protein
LRVVVAERLFIKVTEQVKKLYRAFHSARRFRHYAAVLALTTETLTR